VIPLIAVVAFIAALPGNANDTLGRVAVRIVAWVVMVAGLVPLISFAFALLPFLLLCIPALRARGAPDDA